MTNKQDYASQLETDRERLRDSLMLHSWNSLIEEVRVPLDLRPALAARKPELIALARRRPLSIDECDQLYTLVASLFRTNEALRVHCEEVAGLAHDWLAAMRPMVIHAERIAAFANFSIRKQDGG